MRKKSRSEALPHHTKEPEQTKMALRRIEGGIHMVYEIPESDRVKIPDCPKCWANFVIQHGKKWYEDWKQEEERKAAAAFARAAAIQFALDPWF